MIKTRHFIILITVILLSLSACAAADNENNTSEQCMEHVTDDAVTVEKYDDTYENNDEITNTNIQKKQDNNIKTSNNNVISLTPDNFDTYVTDGILNDNVPDNAILDVQGKFDGEKYAFNITKPVELISTTHDAFFSFYSTPKLEGTNELPDNSFIITPEGSGTNITGITFENTMIVTTYAYNITFDNITSYCTSGYGWGRGSTSIRNSENVTIKNSYFNTRDNNGVSTVVFAASQNCLIENCTVTGSGFIGNLVYATTYNVEVMDNYGNNNITIRNNRIIGRNIKEGVATCYSVCVIGDNITVENNYIENNNKFLIMTQYKDAAYEVDGDTGALLIRNNTFATGKINIQFDPCTIENNTFYGNVTIEATNNTIVKNNINRDANENPYITQNVTPQQKANIQIDAPDSYTYDETINAQITVTDNNNNLLNKGYIEIYTDGKLNKTLSLNAKTITFPYTNTAVGTHRIRVWYYAPDENVSTVQKLKTIESLPVYGQLEVTTDKVPHIGDEIKITARYTLDKDVDVDSNITFDLPKQDPITVKALNKQATITTTITTDYIRDILGGREQFIKVRVITANPNVVIEELSTKLGVQKAQTTITLTPTTVKVNQTTTLTATITTPSNMTINKGTITLKDKNANTIYSGSVKNNNIQTPITFNTPGANEITASYDGTTYFDSTSTTQNIIVKADTNMFIYSRSGDTKGSTIKVSGKLQSNGEGVTGEKVTINVNGKTYTATTGGYGYFTVNHKISSYDNLTVTMSYSGSDYYEATSNSTIYTVKQPTNIYIYPRSGDTKGSTIKVSGKLQNNGEGVKGEKVTINVNGKTYTATTGGYGYFTVNHKISSYDNLTVSMSYAGSKKYEASTNSTIYTVKQPTNIYMYTRSGDKKGSTIKVSGKLQNNGEGVKGEKVTINVNGKTYTATTGGYGYFTVNHKITSYDNLNVTFTYAGNKNYESSTNSTVYKVNPSTTLFIYSRTGDTKGSTIKVSGKLLCAGEGVKGEKITIKVNGKTYTATTGGYGYFTVNHTITTYDNLNISMSYAGSSKYESVSNTTIYTVKQPTNIFMYTRSNDKVGSTIKVSGKLQNNGEGIKGEKVKINVNGKTYTATTGGYGYFTVKYTITKNENLNVTFTYDGSKLYEKSTNTTIYTVKT